MRSFAMNSKTSSSSSSFLNNDIDKARLRLRERNNQLRHWISKKDICVVRTRAIKINKEELRKTITDNETVDRMTREELLMKPNECIDQFSSSSNRSSRRRSAATATALESSPTRKMNKQNSFISISSSTNNKTLTMNDPMNSRYYSIAAAAVAVVTAGALMKKILDTPSRAYVDGANTVGNEYDAWTEEGILEYYWGEHIHLGWYEDEDLINGAGTLIGNDVVDFKQAKFAFVDKMCDWSVDQLFGKKPENVLDVGCGIGGASRHLAKRFGDGTKVTGITLSNNQRDRATDLAKEQNVTNAEFKVMNALEMEFANDSFDIVWACESGEHMPDKKKYVDEMIRVLKPGGVLVIATWCQREADALKNPFTDKEKKNLAFLYEEWAHPFFVSIEEYERLMLKSDKMDKIKGENWVKNTIASWRHSIWVGVWDPWPVVFAGPRIWYKTIREIVTLERMHRAFDSGLMTYGLIKGRKKI
jgi:MPBQ/MSBQ methyltransferase